MSAESDKLLSVLKRTFVALEETRAKLEKAEQAGRDPIAIVGLACRLPGASSDPDAFWALLRDGVDAVREVPAERWDVDALYDPDPDASGKMATRWGGFLQDVDRFDPGFFGIAPREAERMDPQQRILLEVAWEALEDAGQPLERIRGSRTGVFAGATGNDYGWMMVGGDPERLDAHTAAGIAHSVIAGRLSYVLDLRGPSMTIDTACSSSLVAVHEACQSLRNGECSMALAGGVNLVLSPIATVAFSRAHMMASDGRCKTFDSRADGFVRAEGCAVIVLKRLSDARRDRDRVLAVIRGSAVNQDGRTNGLTAPNAESQEAVIRDAVARSGIRASRMGYVETHGTGTALGDPIEVEALRNVYGAPRADGTSCALGSVKASIGHAEAAAGIAGLVKAVLCLEREAIPPQLHFEQLNPRIELEGSCLRVADALQPWPAGSEPRIASVSAFGFSGTNAHVILEEASPTQKDVEPAAERPELVTLSGRDAAALRRVAERHRDYLSAERGHAVAAADIAHTAAVRRSHFEHRLAVVGRSPDELAERLQAYLDGESDAGWCAGRVARRPGRVAFVFSGQGTPWPGMCSTLLRDEPVFRDAAEECDRLLEARTGWSARDAWVADEPRSRLDDTSVAQPALFVAQVALAALWRSWGVAPAAVLGHSVGEVAAAHVAGALALEDAVELIVRRGEALRATRGTGRMLALQVSPEEAQRLVAESRGRLSLAADNAPTATVVSGARDAVEDLAERLRDRNVRHRVLPVDYPFHSHHVDGVLGGLAGALRGLAARDAEVPFLSTVEGRAIPGRELGAAYWVRNVREPVRFARAVDLALEDGLNVFVEISPHAALLGSIAECAAQRGRDVQLVASMRRGRDERETLRAGLGALYVRGHPVALQALHPAPRRCVPLPTYPWERSRCWFSGHPREAAGERLRAARGGTRGPLRHAAELAHPRGTNVWEGEIGGAELPYLDGHRIHGQMVAPGALFVDLLRGATSELRGSGSWLLRDLALDTVLLVPEEGRRMLQLIVSPEGDDRFSAEIHSRAGDAGRWMRHVTASLCALPDAAADRGRVDLEAIRARCGEELDGHAFYRIRAAAGNGWGPAFRGIEHLWLGRDEALARLRVPDGVEPSGAFPHPAVLDACVQPLAATLPPESSAGAFVGRGLRRLWLGAESAGSAVWSHVRRTGDGGDGASFLGDIRLLAADGTIVGEAEGVRFQCLPPDGELRADAVTDECLYELAWEPAGASAGPPAAAVPGDARWIVLADRQGVGEALARSIERRGERCVLVSSSPHPGTPAAGRLGIDAASAREVADDLSRALPPGEACRGVVHLWSLDVVDPEKEGIDALESSVVQSCLGLAGALQHAAARSEATPPRVWLVTRGGQPATSAGAPPAPGQAAVWGFGRAVAQGHADVWGGAVDLDPASSAADAAEALLAELESPGGAELAYRDGERRTCRLRRRPEPAAAASPLRLHADATYVIAGGLGDLGLATADWMVKRGARHLLLVAREGLPPRSLWSGIAPGTRAGDRVAAVEALEQRGARVGIASADVGDEEQLRAVLAGVADGDGPPVRGVVHAAGSIAEEPVAELDAGSLGRALRAKLRGGWLLHHLARELPLDFFVTYSSLASLLSSPSLAGYAAANAFLDGLAHQRRALGAAALSVDWGPWAGIGMAARNRARGEFSLRAVGSLPPERALEILGRLLQAGASQVVVLRIDWAEWARLHPGAASLPLLSPLVGDAAPDTDAGRAALSLDVFRAADTAGQMRLVESYLRRQVARALGLSESKLDAEEPLANLGIDSLMAMELRKRLELDLGVLLPIVNVLEGPSLRELVAVVLEALRADAPAASRVEPDRVVVLDRDPEQLLRDLEHLSDEEVSAVLTELTTERESE